MAKAKTQPSKKQMNQALKGWLTDEENNPHRLVSLSKFKALAKEIDPSIRLDKKAHAEVCKMLGRALVRAIERTYDNKRSTIRSSDF